jgi:hypothetical protein
MLTHTKYAGGSDLSFPAPRVQPIGLRARPIRVILAVEFVPYKVRLQYSIFLYQWFSQLVLFLLFCFLAL